MSNKENLMSVFNHKTGGWELHNVSRETGLKFATDKDGVTHCVNKPRQSEEPREEIQGYEMLRGEALSHFFTTGFLQAANTDPVYNSILMQLGQGQSPYAVIEALLRDRQTLSESIMNLSTQLGEAELKILKLQHGKAAS